MYSNKYTLIYAIGISILTAILLAFAAEGLRPYQEANIKLDVKTSILRAVHETSTERDYLEKTYRENVRELVVNSKGDTISDIKATDIVLKKELDKPVHERRLPLYIYTGADTKKKYIIPLQGKGLWGPIYGFISLEDDFNTVYGTYFSHKSETPGLGAEIAEKPFQDQFQGKEIMGDSQQFVSVRVVKENTKVPYGPEHVVDGITGGTITSQGTDQMLLKGLEPYLSYFAKIKSES